MRGAAWALVVVTLVAGCRAGRPVSLPLGPSPSAGQRGVVPGLGTPTSPAAAQRSAARSPASGPLAGRVVVLDPGHDGDDAAHPAIINRLVNVITEDKPCDAVGAQTADGYPEHAFNFDVATRTAALLRAAGARVVLTRPNDTGVGPCITVRAAIGNAAHADAVVSIHADGGPVAGYGFHLLEPAPVGPNDAIVPASDRLALALRSAYAARTGEPYSTYLGQSGLDVRSDLGGLNLSTAPKVFIECANMRNAADAARLEDPAWRQRAAEGIARGVTAFLASAG